MRKKMSDKGDGRRLIEEEEVGKLMKKTTLILCGM